ncbi:MAG: hypothetical protein U0800_07260 [Isosphaeraceae bacterium]
MMQNLDRPGRRVAVGFVKAVAAWGWVCSLSAAVPARAGDVYVRNNGPEPIWVAAYKRVMFDMVDGQTVVSGGWMIPSGQTLKVVSAYKINEVRLCIVDGRSIRPNGAESFTVTRAEAIDVQKPKFNTHTFWLAVPGNVPTNETAPLQPGDVARDMAGRPVTTMPRSVVRTEQGVIDTVRNLGELTFFRYAPGPNGGTYVYNR